MSEEEEEPLSAVDVAYDFIDKAGDDWTRDELLAALARAGFPLRERLDRSTPPLTWNLIDSGKRTFSRCD